MQRENLITRLVDIFVGLVMLVLGLRVLFRLFNANTTAGFVEWIYETSDVIMAPFRGIFPPATIEEGHVLDFSALFAIVVYAILGFLLTSLIASFAPARDSKKNRK